MLASMLALTACSNSGGGIRPDPTALGGGAGPLQANVVEGGAISSSSMKLATNTYGIEVCSNDRDAEIVIDGVRYDTEPELAETNLPTPEVPSIGTWFREVPPVEEGGYYPIMSADGPAERLPGDAHGIPGGGYALPVEHTCDDAVEDRWPMTEMLTQITAGPAGGIATRTYVDYHVGSARYTLTVKWAVGACGTDVPESYGCRAKAR